MSWCVNSIAIAELENNLRLVERDEMRDTAFEMLRHHPGKAGKGFRCFAAQPAAGFFQRLRQLPVIERHPRRDAVCKAAVYHAVIVLEPGLIPGAAALRVDARPTGGKPVGAQTELRKKADILFITMVAVTGHRAVFVICNGIRPPAEYIPDAFTAAVCGWKAFRLIGA